MDGVVSGARETHAGGHPARSRITPVTSAPVRQQPKHHQCGAPPRLPSAPLASGAAEPAHACSSASAGAKATVSNTRQKPAIGLRPAAAYRSVKRLGEVTGERNRRMVASIAMTQTRETTT